MPELPEVETIARALRNGGRGGPSILGWRVKDIHVLWMRTLAMPELAEVKARLVGQVVEDIGRRGKFLLVQFSQDVLLMHLRMSGDLRVEPVFDLSNTHLPFQPHDRLVIEFDNGMRLAFNDTRKFGRVWLAANPEEITGRLGPEPFDPSLTPERFFEMLHRRSRQIKPLLLDQTFLAGLGNIYTDEALFTAQIHPLQSADLLTFEQSNRLLHAIRRVLKEGIERNGASFDWVYKGGTFAFQVYQRTGQPCPNCGTPIEKSTVGQRGTHFCPTCQTLLIKQIGIE